MKQLIPQAKDCFCCGTDNPIGLHLSYYFENNRILTEFILDKKYGYSEHIIHSGIVLGILVEAMGWVPAYILQNPEAFLVDLNVRILKPMPINKKLCALAEAISINHWVSQVQGIIKDAQGEIYVTATSKFTIKSSDAKTLSGHYI